MSASGYGDERDAPPFIAHIDGATEGMDLHELPSAVQGNARGFVAAADGSLCRREPPDVVRVLGGWREFSGGRVIERLAGDRLDLLVIPSADAGAGDLVATPDGRTLWFGE